MYVPPKRWYLSTNTHTHTHTHTTFPSAFPTKTYAFISPAHVTCHSHLVLLDLIALHLVTSTYYEAPRYAGFSILLLLPLVYPNFLLSTPFLECTTKM